MAKIYIVTLAAIANRDTQFCSIDPWHVDAYADDSVWFDVDPVVPLLKVFEADRALTEQELERKREEIALLEGVSPKAVVIETVEDVLANEERMGDYV